MLIAVWAAWCFFFLNKGIDFTDEGFYCSEAWRFAQGDLPFRDSIHVVGLSFWWASWIFRIYPECGLLGLRIIWAVFMLLCAFITAKMMLRYFNPWISFAGPAIVLVLPTAYYIKVLSYNSLPILPLLLVALLWISACRQNGKLQILPAAGAGLMAFLATTCRPSLVAIIILPALTMIYDYLCGYRMNRLLRATTAFVAAYLFGCACFFSILASTGLLDSFLATLFLSGQIELHSYSEMFRNFILSLCFYLLPALAIPAIMCIWRFKNVTALPRKHKYIAAYVAVLMAMAIAFISILNWNMVRSVIDRLTHSSLVAFNAPYYAGPLTHLVFLALAIGVVLADVFFSIIDSRAGKGSIEVQDRCRLGFLAVFLSFLMVLGTANVPARSIDHMSFLPISMAAGLLWLWIPKTTSTQVRKGCSWALQVAVIGLLVLMPYCRLFADDLHARRDARIDALVATPTAAKLHGIHTQRERAQLIDKLVEAVKQNSQPGDRILAYETLPMLYYLTDRLPATNTTFLSWWCSRPLREYLIEDMVGRNRIPKLVIRAIYRTNIVNWPAKEEPVWGSAQNQEIDPIDTYVRENYKVIQEIDGWFQIMVPAERSGNTQYFMINRSGQ